MRAALGLFLAAIAAVAIAWWVSALPGSVTASIAGTTIQTSTPVAIALFAVVFLVLYAVVRLLAGLLALPKRTGRWREGRARSKGEAAMNRALIALAVNDPGAARREADRGRRLLGDTPMTLLLAAQAGKQAGRDDEAAALYELLADRKDSRLLGLRGLLRLAVEQEDWTRAAAIADHAEQAHSGARWLAEERRWMAQQTGQWHEAMRLSPPDAKAAMAVEAARQESDPKLALGMARQAFEAEPGLPPAAVAYAEKLRATGKERQADEVLRKAWLAGPHPDIAEAFAAGLGATAGDPVGRAREMAVLVRNNPQHPESHLAVARAALDAGLVDDARRQLELAREGGVNDRRFWTLLADACAMEGDVAGQQEALQHLPNAEPDPVWRCTSCGTHYDAWQPVCQHCRATGAIRWSQPGDASSVRPRIAAPSGLDSFTA